MSKITQNVTLNWLGHNFIVKKVPMWSWSNEDIVKLSSDNTSVAKLIRELILKPMKFAGKIDKFWVKSRHGTAIDVYVYKKEGLDYRGEIYTYINDLLELFELGNFNGMTDSYDYKSMDSRILGILETGEKVDFGCRFISLETKAPWGSKEYKRYE